eukprot:15484706-Alexandrium_andersonii.AAC.1
MLRPCLDQRSSSFERLMHFRISLDRRVMDSSAELRGAPGSSGKLGSFPLSLLTLLEGRQGQSPCRARI